MIDKNWLLRIGWSEAPRDRWKVVPLVVQPDFPLFYWVMNGFVRRESCVYRVARPNDAFDRSTGQRRDWLNVLGGEMASETKSGIASIYTEEFIAIVPSDYSVGTIETSTWWTIENGKRYRDWSTLSEKGKRSYYFSRGSGNCLKQMIFCFILLIKSMCMHEYIIHFICSKMWYNLYKILTYYK